MRGVEFTRSADVKAQDGRAVTMPRGVVGTAVYYNEQRDRDGMLWALVQIGDRFYHVPQDVLAPIVWRDDR